MNHPLTGFHFQVIWGGTRLGFTQVNGLDMRIEPIEYREGDSAFASPLRVPGLVEYSHIVLERGMMLHDNEFFEWVNTALRQQPERRDLIIHLLDERHEPVSTWKARNAWPVSLHGPTLDAARNAVAIERLEVAHEGLSVSSGD